MKYTAIVSVFVVLVVLLSSCKDFFNPEQEINVTEEQLYKDWYEYRAIEMGMYGIQAKLVEQIVVLGELRADLLQITENADADMVEIYNFNISKENKYASPTNFFKLISAANNFIKVLQREHPEVLDPKSPVSNYDKLYGEALCMRAWAYFNAVRIYGKVPFIHESLTTMDEIEDYLNSSGTYIDSVHINFSIDGYYNDTVYNKPIELQKQYFDEKLVISHFTEDLEKNVKGVGVNHYIDNNDASWEVSIWNPYAMNALLGIMYLTEGDLAKAAQKFEKIVYAPSENYRYQLDASFRDGQWRNIFSNIDSREHIFTLWFNKSYFQQNQFQSFFEPREPHKYMLKPTKASILYWESTFNNYSISANNARPWETELVFKGFPGEANPAGFTFPRGHGVSYSYVRNGVPLDDMTVFQMLWLKSEEDYRTAQLLVENVDTAVWKFSWNKDIYAQDANFPIYRAGGVHLWLAEVYTWWQYNIGGVVRPFTSNAVNIMNDGSNYTIDAAREQLGVRGRVGVGGAQDGLRVGNINYIHHPYTNEVIDYIDLTGDFVGKQLYLEEKIIEERARELAYEGERFYDLMRVAKRRNEPAFLAERVAAKFPADRQEAMYNYLLNPDNWYIHYFD